MTNKKIIKVVGTDDQIRQIQGFIKLLSGNTEGKIAVQEVTSGQLEAEVRGIVRNWLETNT